MTIRSAVVLLSGGLDSATVLAMARAQGFACHALSIDYGQRHSAELAAAARVAEALGAVRHAVAKVDLSRFGGSALTDASIAVPETDDEAGGEDNDKASDEADDGEPRPAASPEIPVTYVPARNTIMLSIALGWAEVLGADDIFFGANAIDYSGYPDCRPAFVQAFEALANLATRSAVEGRPIRINAPIIDLSKAQIIQEGLRLGVDYALTVTCYQADDAGRACGRCDACRIRRAGFAAAGVADPTRYRSG
ncbi:MAG: 7-cyano-7-deazaguanine synthase QueC [Burkholderiaceae bacterium]